MSQEKIEAIILTDDGIMIQELTYMKRSDVANILRIPSMEELGKIADGCTDSIKKMREVELKMTNAEALLDMLYNESVEKHGPNNVRKEEGHIVVNDAGKEHKIWIETV